MPAPEKVPLAIVRNLICAHCGSFLSIGPIYGLPDNRFLCGRCVNFARQQFQNVVYELIATLFLFPCKYWSKHCESQLKWNKIEHEKNCSYRGGCALFCSHPFTSCKSLRELPRNGDDYYNLLSSELWDRLLCRECQCYLSCGPIFYDINGRNVCHRCINAKGVPEECLQNYIYEALAGALIFPCTYRNRGCTYMDRFGKKLWIHETSCSYRPAPPKTSLTSESTVGRIVKKKMNQKERGVIQTQIGHTYGTITETKALKTNLIKSLKSHQERKIKRVDESDTFQQNGDDNGSLDDSSKTGTIDSNSSLGADSYNGQNPMQEFAVEQQPTYYDNRGYQQEPPFIQRNPSFPREQQPPHFQQPIINPIHQTSYHQNGNAIKESFRQSNQKYPQAPPPPPMQLYLNPNYTNNNPPLSPVSQFPGVHNRQGSTEEFNRQPVHNYNVPLSPGDFNPAPQYSANVVHNRQGSSEDFNRQPVQNNFNPPLSPGNFSQVPQYPANMGHPPRSNSEYPMQDISSIAAHYPVIGLGYNPSFSEEVVRLKHSNSNVGNQPFLGELKQKLDRKNSDRRETNQRRRHINNDSIQEDILRLQ